VARNNGGNRGNNNLNNNNLNNLNNLNNNNLGNNNLGNNNLCGNNRGGNRGMFRGLVAGVASMVLLVGAPVAASAAESSPVDELAAMMEITEAADLAQLELDVEAMAEAEGIPTSQVVEDALNEARDAFAASRPEASDDVMSTRSAGCTTVRPPAAVRRGDVIYSPAGMAGLTYGHSAIYLTTKTLVEAPGPGIKSRVIHHLNARMCKGSALQYVETTQAKRNAAANLAVNRYKGKPYDLAFYNNKQNGDHHINCSELVWRAYRYSGAGISIDSNGGSAVYPSNIRDSSYTTTYRRI
jgi:uncharacterized protein YycO